MPEWIYPSEQNCVIQLDILCFLHANVFYWSQTLVTAEACAWYSVHSLWRDRGYLMARTVPMDVPVKRVRPERDMTMLV